MTVKELIEYLSKENPDTEVVVSGYESGFDSINTIFKKHVREVSDKNWYDGYYEQSQGDGGKVVLALLK
jgi:hypothetical protein